MKVLVVDDISANRLVLTALLRRAGYEASAAANAEEAESRFATDRPEAVLTDLHLGEGADGTELAGRLRRMPGGESVRIGLLTGDARSSLQGTDVFDAVLEKPVSLETLESFLKGV